FRRESYSMIKEHNENRQTRKASMLANFPIMLEIGLRNLEKSGTLVSGGTMFYVYISEWSGVR
ncbi:hypothetical protein ACJX0J_031809, partial [Zea mays]